MAGLGRGTWGLAAAHAPALLMAGCALAALAFWRLRGNAQPPLLDDPATLLPLPLLPLLPSAEAAVDEKPRTPARISPADPVVDPSLPRRYRPSPIGRRPRTLRACQGRRAEPKPTPACAPPEPQPLPVMPVSESGLSLFTSNDF
ncbi:hypothetical protein H4R19_003465 [Coemansia spiralis]|nr:hypothetical protein H4R19_003465 [Coemansia spiralis]